MTDTQDYRRLHEIFAAVCELEGPEREAELDRRCGDDAELRRRVEDLLRFHEQEDGALARPIIDDGAPPPQDQPGSARSPRSVTTAASAVTEGPGTTIGRYKLLQPIGEGGFGVVYMAEQERPVRRRVALKIIKLGMDTKQVIARFEAERQALALMDHPNIAKVLDAGATDTGRPYFVMELVKGEPITA
ncbi:MAG: protein kinase domain-containing protein, partial [Planctomycetota bacterium]